MTDDPQPHTLSPASPDGQAAPPAGKDAGTRDAGPKDDRAERLARALRDNLRRRKEQERARGGS
ncbi:hypothetical protein [Rhodospirillum centenum]|uniref:Uncharacterized protein n=1 Tax=Rhodospirillum centenum (strain ATCC 51521 / SW) TaxID=414684 RepID=B6INF9_RHOCS|nr:hypothetical protein [Rhodospirillum centenum]ACI99056.1 hypothetical protein RC1_1655 [Rhodospirillum centenum SW]